MATQMGTQIDYIAHSVYNYTRERMWLYVLQS